MRDGWQETTLGRMAVQSIDPLDLVDDVLYANLGVKWYAAGTFRRDPKLGSAIKATRLFHVKPGQFVYNRMFATEGSFAIIRPEDATAVVSNEFPVFDLDESQVLGSYLCLYFQRRSVWARVAEQCVGTTKSRLRWKEDRFAAFPAALPPVPEQRRIVDLVGAVDDAIEAAEETRSKLAAALASRRNLAFGTPGDVRLAGDMFDILIGLQRSPARADGPDQTKYLRSYNVTAGRLILDDVKTMSFTRPQQEKYRLMAGDVLVSEGSASADAVGAPSEYHEEVAGLVCFQNTLLRYRAIAGVSTPAFVSQ